VSVALAHLAVGEVPEAGLALVTLPPIRIGMAGALSRDQVTVVVFGANAVTVAGLATFRAEAVVAGGAFIAGPAHNVWLALTIAAELFAFFAQRSRRVALAGWNEQIGRLGCKNIPPQEFNLQKTPTSQVSWPRMAEKWSQKISKTQNVLDVFIVSKFFSD
jgi:hypothetical protein